MQDDKQISELNLKLTPFKNKTQNSISHTRHKIAIESLSPRLLVELATLVLPLSHRFSFKFIISNFGQ